MAGDARAEEARGAPVDVSVRYAAPAEACPSASVFETGVTSRTRRARIVAAGSSPANLRRFDVTIMRSATDFVGTMRSANGDTREVRAVACPELADALALITALAIDPHAATVPPSSAPVPAPKPMPMPTPAAATPRNATAGAPAEPRRDAPVSRGIELRAGAIAHMGATPAPLYGVAVAAWTTRGTFAGWIGADVASRPAQTNGAYFTQIVLEIGVCPLAWAPSASLRVRPCAVANGGVIDALGTGIAHPSARIAPWFDVGPALTLEWTFARAAFLYGDAALPFSLTRPTFITTVPDRVVYDVPLLTVSLGIGVGVLFP